MNIILFDTSSDWQNFLPFSFTRPLAHIRIGILTIAEKWEKLLQANISFLSEPYLQDKFKTNLQNDNLFINSVFLPNDELIESIKNLPNNTILSYQNEMIAYRGITFDRNNFDKKNIQNIDYQGIVNQLKSITDIFSWNGKQIQFDFQLLTKNRTSQKITDKYTAVYKEENIFIEEGVNIKASILNAENGVIYLGKNSTISEGSIIQGNFALCEGATINPAGKMRGDTTIGPYCKVGGEISNSVLFGYSNKGHEGFLGNSVLGEWCNLGADTNNSNLKNNYAEVKIWNYLQKKEINTKLQFCGLLMGDHSKAGINTMFNTGTVVGVSSNIFGADFPAKFVPSFRWGGSNSLVEYKLDKALETANRMMERRKLKLSEEEIKIFEYILAWETNNL
ncbi:MAG: glucose-1-phosphate thymidylyltransferase [Bacteroidetes bacterium]|nr:MAG: glucose-1-phosphate thymidylyltransferase [Bacteroidota bacterium]